ncbi:MAG: CPBP family intramembrane metalloprotease, partial [Leptolyngbya sp. SIO1D8]|nr:CPBP family intramembrane metalloprotease [Leptolyngbya sp. SIO1D8]
LTWRVWEIILGALWFYGAIALPYGFRSGFLHFSVAGFRHLLHPIWLLQLFIMPALLEEGIFRVLLLPHPLEGVSLMRWLLWTGLSLTIFVLYHPLNAILFYPAGRGTFWDQRFLLLALLLGIVCSSVYAMTGSLWAIALIHWIVVIVWLQVLGGQYHLHNQQSLVL